MYALQTDHPIMAIGIMPLILLFCLLYRAVNKYSQTAMNKKQKLAQSLAPKHLKLHNFLNKRRDKLKSTSTVNLKVGKSVSVLL